ERAPVRLGDLRRVDAQLAARVLGGETDHQRVGERPRLAAEVAHLAELDAHLLADLAAHRLLERLAGLHESRERAVEPGRQVVAAAEQHAVAAPHQNDDRRRDAREAGQLAARATPRQLVGQLLAGGAAAPTEAVSAPPL